MRWTRAVAIGAAALIVAGMVSTAGAQTGGKKPTATEIGVTDKEIRIAVIADDENALRPGLFHNSPVAVQAFAKNINAHGGLAGRKLVVDVLDSHLSADEARNAIIKACAEDFALVGTEVLFMNNVDDMVECHDKQGAATGLPDVAALVLEVAHQCSPVTYAINPSLLDCSTLNQTPQTWRWNAGRVRYEQKAAGKKLHGVFIYGSDLRAGKVTALAIHRASQKVGVGSDGEFGVSARATQSGFTPIVSQMQSAGSNFAQVINTGTTAIDLRKEAKLQGVDAKSVVWDCGSQCYEPTFLTQGGADVDGIYAGLQQLPFEEAKSNKELASYVKSAGKANVSGFGSYAWIASVLFRDSVNAIVKKAGVNGLTRKALFDQLKATTTFDAGGMWGAVNIAERTPSACFMVLQIQNGEYVRVYPKKPGTMDCKKRNVVTYQDDILGE